MSKFVVSSNSYKSLPHRYPILYPQTTSNAIHRYPRLISCWRTLFERKQSEKRQEEESDLVVIGLEMPFVDISRSPILSIPFSSPLASDEADKLRGHALQVTHYEAELRNEAAGLKASSRSSTEDDESSGLNVSLAYALPHSSAHEDRRDD